MYSLAGETPHLHTYGHVLVLHLNASHQAALYLARCVKCSGGYCAEMPYTAYRPGIYGARSAHAQYYHIQENAGSATQHKEHVLRTVHAIHTVSANPLTSM